jgi:hypothetical protein
MDAAASKAKPNPDATLLTLIARHDHLWSEWKRLAQNSEDDPRIAALIVECAELEPRIIAMPAHTERGLAGKRRVINVSEYACKEGRPELTLGDVNELVGVILELDAERIASAR